MELGTSAAAGQRLGIASSPDSPPDASPAVARRRRPQNRQAPERRPEFGALTLPELRSYRELLTAEEERVSYWRRLVQARLDLARAALDGSPPMDLLRDVLSGMQVTSHRTALVRMVHSDDIPELPELASLWARRPAEGDDRHNAELAESLDQAERQLSSYREVLHARIEAATGELIARYREEPALCLVALPERGR